MQDHDTVPYGYCHCGCGEKTPLASKTVRKRGVVKGEALTYIRGHNSRLQQPQYICGPDPTRRFCMCGCGREAPIATQTNRKRGLLKGQPCRYIRGHQGRIEDRYDIVDTGFDTPCHLWQGSTLNHGHVTISRDGHQILAHRFYYEARYGAIPAGLDLHHRCQQKTCVNPDHLEPLTHREHMARHRGRATHCKHGHEFTQENTYIVKDKYRGCRTCRREDLRERYRRHREKAQASERS